MFGNCQPLETIRNFGIRESRLYLYTMEFNLEPLCWIQLIWKMRSASTQSVLLPKLLVTLSEFGYPVWTLWFSCSLRSYYLVFIYFGFGRTWGRLFQKRILCTKFDTYVFFYWYGIVMVSEFLFLIIKMYHIKCNSLLLCMYHYIQIYNDIQVTVIY